MDYDEQQIRNELQMASQAMRPNPDRARSVIVRGHRAHRVRAAGTAIGAVSLVALAAGAFVALTPAGDATPQSTASTTERTSSINSVRVVPRGLAVTFVGADPALSTTSPCYVAYRLDSASSDSPHELVVTVTSSRGGPATEHSEATTLCPLIGFARTLTLDMDVTMYTTIIDGHNGRRHPLP